MQSTLRRLLSSVLLQDTDINSISNDLRAAGVPVSEDPCRSCEDPCSSGHEPYPARMDIDMETRMLGTVHPYRRQVIISTGKSDWPTEVTWERSSLAQHLFFGAFSVPSGLTTSSGGPHISGIWKETETKNLGILNGSHYSLSEEDDKETVLIFPDYTIVNEVPRSSEGAKLLYTSSIGTTIPNGGALVPDQGLRTFVIPYSVVILLCSHKRRDNRCAIAAPKLENRFREVLEGHEWAVDVQLNHHDLGPALESIPDRSEYLTARLKALGNEKRALILKTSHIGGHKYSGVVNIYFPKGIGIWYGRVSTHEVESIVMHTIEEGKVLPALLRGGLNLAQPNCKSFLEW